MIVCVDDHITTRFCITLESVSETKQLVKWLENNVGRVVYSGLDMAMHLCYMGTDWKLTNSFFNPNQWFLSFWSTDAAIKFKLSVY